MSITEKIRSGIESFSGAIVGLFTGVMTLSVLLAVVARYVLKISIPWTEELARYLAIGLTYVGAGLALREGKHVGLEYFTAKLSKSGRILAGVVWKVIVLLFFAVFIYESWMMMILDGTWQISPAMRMPMTIPYFTLFLGGIVMALELVFSISDDLVAFRGARSQRHLNA